MPDGDRVHSGLARQYQKVYKQICEGQFGAESLAQEALAAVKRRLKQIGDEAIDLIQQASSQIAQIPDEPLLREIVDWTAESRAIDSFAQQTLAPKRIVEYIAEASKELIYEIRNDISAERTETYLMERTFHKLYISEVEESMPLAEHYNGADQQHIDTRLEEMRPYVYEGLADLSKQAVNKGSFEHLRQPTRSKPKIDLHNTDILSMQ